MNINVNTVLASVLGGVVVGFSIGAGYILAQRVMNKKKNSTPAPAPADAGFAGYTGEQIVQPRNERPIPPPTKRSFDFTTGNGSW